MNPLAEAIVPILLAVLGKGLLWLGLAFVISALLRSGQASAGQRRLFWTATVLSLALLACLEPGLPKRTLPLPLPEFAIESTAPAPVAAPAASPTEVATISSSPTVLPTIETAIDDPASSRGRFNPSFGNWLAIAWLGGTLAVVAALIRARLRLAGWWRASVEAGPDWQKELEAAGRILERRGRLPELRQSPAVSTPLVWGLWHPKLLIPSSLADSAASASRRLILLHELCHVARRDAWLNLLSHVALAIHWPNPLAWLAARRLRQAQEEACDDLVLELAGSPLGAGDYADLLLDLAKPRATDPSGTRLGDSAVAFSIAGRPSALRQRITSILDTSMNRKHPTTPLALAVLTLQLLAVATLALFAFGETASAADRQETDALRERVAELEAEVAQLREQTAAVREKAELEKIVEENRLKARERMREDLEEYDRDELRAIEELYQVANRNWRTEEARESLEELVDEYKKANRTGCALLYLGQYSEGEQREAYLRKAIEDFSDCYYGDGCQVGGYARYLLAAYLKENGRDDEAAEIIAEIEKDYATATGHSGKLIVDYLDSLR